MSSELRPPALGNNDTEALLRRGKEGPNALSDSAHDVLLTRTNLQEAAEIASSAAVQNAIETQSAPSAFNLVGPNTSHHLHQNSGSPPNGRQPPSPVPLSNENSAYRPRGPSDNYQFPPKPTSNSGQRQHNRSSSLPMAPYTMTHPQSRPMFYTPQMGPHGSTPLWNTTYTHPRHNSQPPIDAPRMNRIPQPATYTPQTQLRAQMSDAFVPNDPFRIHKGNQQRETDFTFDDIHITPIQTNFMQHPGQNEAYRNPNDGRATGMPSMSSWSQPIHQSWNQPLAPGGQPWQPWDQSWRQASQPWSQGSWVSDSPSHIIPSDLSNPYESAPSNIPSQQRQSSTSGSPFPVTEQHKSGEELLSDQTTKDESVLESVLQYSLPEAHSRLSPHSSAKASLETAENTADTATDSVSDESSSFWSNFKRVFALSLARRIFHSRPDFVMPYYTRPPVTRANTERAVVQLVTTTLPHQIYLHMLLRLPSLYFSRVARIFEEADLTMREIKKMALETSTTNKGLADLHIFDSQNIAPQYTRLKSTWEAFIDSVMREWKTFNIISVLLLSAILTILQIDSAAQQPITRYTALSSLICALISLLFGCMYIIRFSTMRKAYRAAEWAMEAQKTRTTVWWNVWVLLAMPAIWLTWSILLYIVCIMSFIWLTSAEADMNLSPTHMSPTTLLVVRIIISAVLGLGILYGVLIMSTFRRYGEAMDNTWKKRIDRWVEEKKFAKYSYSPGGYGPRHQTPPQYGGPGLPPNFQPFHPAPDASGGFASTPLWPPFTRDFPPTFDPTYRPQQSGTDADTPVVSPTTPPPLREISYAGFGYFSDRKNLFSEVETEEPSPFFIPPLVAEEARALNPLRQDTANSALSSLRLAPSPKRTEELEIFAGQPSSPFRAFPEMSGSDFDVPIPIARTGSTVSQDNALGLRNELDDDIKESQELRTRAVRFRSPLVSPEVSQHEHPIRVGEESLTPMDSMYFDLAGTGSSTITRDRTSINAPRSATAESAEALAVPGSSNQNLGHHR